MRPFRLGVGLVLGLLASACVATQLQHNCPGPCGDGQICDATVGECKGDPCNGKCNAQGQRCQAGPPPKCIDLSVGEARESGPDEPGIPRSPPSPGQPQ